MSRDLLRALRDHIARLEATNVAAHNAAMARVLAFFDEHTVHPWKRPVLERNCIDPATHEAELRAWRAALARAEDDPGAMRRDPRLRDFMRAYGAWSAGGGAETFRHPPFRFYHG
jgi:hypothetical protein